MKRILLSVVALILSVSVFSQIDPHASIEPGTYIITSRVNGKVIDQSVAKRDAIVYNRHGGENQQWIIESVGDGAGYGYFTITSKVNGKVIDQSVAKNDAIVYKKHGGDNQLWYFAYTGDGYFFIVSKVNNKVLDQDVLNSNLIVYKRHGGQNQQWSFERIK